VKNTEFLRQEAETARRLGYIGKSAIHPSQVAIINEVFRPTQAEIAHSLKVVASAREAAVVRSACGPDFLVVTPGLRPAGHQLDDQRRAATPAEAVRAGADILVVGRPITGAAAPLDAARRILEEMARAASE